MIICIKCGNHVEAGSFCGYCGTPAPAAQQYQQPQYQQPQYQQPQYHQPQYHQQQYQPPQPVATPPQYQPPPQYYPQQLYLKKPSVAGALTFSLISLLLAAAALVFVLIIGLEDRMIELVIVLGVLGAAIIITLIVCIMRGINGIIRAVAIIAVLIAAVAVTLFFFKSDEDMIGDRLNTFAAAFNEGDLSGVIDCFDPQTRGMLNLVSGVGNLLIGGFMDSSVSLNDIFGTVLGIYGEQATVFISVRSIEFINSDRAIAHITVRVGYHEDYISIPMLKDNFDWFIDASDYMKFW